MVHLPDRLPKTSGRAKALAAKVVRETKRELDELNEKLIEAAAIDLVKRTGDGKVTRQAVEAAIDRATNKYTPTKERILRRLSSIAFTDMGDFIESDGTPTRNFGMVPSMALGAVQELQIAHSIEEVGRTEDGEREYETIRHVKIRLYDPRPSLEALGRHIGMSFEDRGHPIDPDREGGPPTISEVEYVVVDPVADGDEPAKPLANGHDVSSPRFDGDGGVYEDDGTTYEEDDGDLA